MPTIVSLWPRSREALTWFNSRTSTTADEMKDPGDACPTR